MYLIYLYYSIFLVPYSLCFMQDLCLTIAYVIYFVLNSVMDT